MFMRTKNFSLILLLASLCLGQSARAYYDPTAGRFISFDSVAPPVGSMDGYSFANGDPVNQFDSDGRLGKGFYAGLTDSSVPANASSAFMAGYTGGGVSGSYYGTLFNEGEAVVSPSTYINGAESFGNNISTVYQSDGLVAAGSYAATSWNVGAVWSGAANINLATGEPVGNGVDQAEDILGGIAGTAGIATAGVAGFTTVAGSGTTTAAADVGIANPVPSTLARIVNADYAASPTLGSPQAADVFVTSASDISGINTSQGLANRLTLLDSAGNLRQGPFAVIQFDTPASGLASPVFRNTPGFIQGGLTGGGASEFVLPNMQINQLQNVTTRIIP